MIQVTQKEFYNHIGPKDAVVSVENVYKYPYTSLFKLRNGTLLGKVASDYTDGVKHKYPIVNTYFLNINKN